MPEPSTFLLRDPELLADEPAQRVSDLRMPRHRHLEAIGGIHVDIVPCAMPKKRATRAAELANELAAIHRR